MITTEIKTHVILFHDKSKLHVTEVQANAVFQQSNGIIKGIKINGNFYSFSDIKKVLTLADFYDQYPNEIPVDRTTSNFDSLKPYVSLEAQGMASETNKKQMIAGISDFIEQSEARGDNPIHAKSLLKGWLEHRGTNEVEFRKAITKRLLINIRM